MIELDPQMLLTQIQAEKAPETWWVMRPKSQVRFVTIFGAILFGIGFNFLYVIIGTAVISLTAYQQVVNNPFDIYTLNPLLALLPQLATVGLILLMRNQAKHGQDSALVLLPEGIVHYKRLSNESKRKITMIEYRKTEKIVLLLRSTAFDIVADDLISHGIIVFEIHYQNGKKETWYPPLAFGHSREIAQWVIKTYRAFKLQETKKGSR